MTVRVLVVDDSAFFRRRVTEILEQDPGLTVVGDAANGKEAIEQTAKLKPDVITMDIEMPVMDGITAVKNIMQVTPTPVIMFSSLTHEGAKATLDALEAGAADFLPKRFEDIAKDKKEGTKLLQDRVKGVARKTPSVRSTLRSSSSFTQTKPVTSLRSTTPPVREERKPFSSNRTTSDIQAQSIQRSSVRASGKQYKLLAIGTSTGGPVALQKVLTEFPAHFNQPIILVQHMPAAFTPAFATRLNTLCKISVKEAENGESLKPGTAYLAPGGKQMLIEGRGTSATIKIMDDDSERVTYKPSVDLSFGSAAKVYGGDVLGVILTGMGADGREGSRMLKQRGAKVWAQDEASCVVYGMPQAVAAAGISEQDIALDNMASSILKEMNYG